MAKRKPFEDPLNDIDPVMEQAFSDFAEDPQPQSNDDDTLHEEENHDGGDHPEIADIQFPSLVEEHHGKKVEMDVFGNIPINISVELGRSQVSLKEVFELSEGSIIELERLVGEPLDLVVNGQIIAHGEVVAIDNNYGLRITSVISTPGQA
jgi:flagellar motor switch protein FliN/FliY